MSRIVHVVWVTKPCHRVLHVKSNNGVTLFLIQMCDVEVVRTFKGVAEKQAHIHKDTPTSSHLERAISTMLSVTPYCASSTMRLRLLSKRVARPSGVRLAFRNIVRRTKRIVPKISVAIMAWTEMTPSFPTIKIHWRSQHFNDYVDLTCGLHLHAFAFHTRPHYLMI